MRDVSTAELLNGAIKAKLAELMTCTVGRIKKYDSKLQVAEIELVMLRPYNLGGEIDHEEIPPIPNVPIVFPRAGGFYMHLPIVEGDHVLVIFTHDNIAMWRETGEKQEPDDLRRHSLASCVAIPGVAPMIEPMLDETTNGIPAPPGFPDDEAVIKGNYRFGSQAAVPVAMAPVVDAFFTAFKAHKHGTGVGPTTTPLPPEGQLTLDFASKTLKADAEQLP